MGPFRFRADLVLDLRRREEEAARTALARQRVVCDRAQAALAAARDAVLEAGRALDSAAASGTIHGTLEWHRSWIIRLRLVAVKQGAEPFALKGADGKYLPEVLLDLDYWALMPI